MKGHETLIASRLRSWEGAGNDAQQQRIRRRGQALARRFVDHHRRKPPDLWFTYHLYHKAPDWIGPAVADALGIPYVVAEASLAPKQRSGLWAEGHRATASALARADQVISLSPGDIECVRPVLKGPNRLTTMLPFIETLEPNRAAAKRDEYRPALADSFGINSKIPWLITVAMMREGDKLNSYRSLGRALRHLDDLEWALLVVGDGPARAQVEAALGMPDRIHYLGVQRPQQICQASAAADLFCWPAINEAYGMALLEAQAAGLPVVAGSEPGVAQIVDQGRSGLLVPSGDAKAFAEATRTLLLAPERRAKMRLAALEKTTILHDISVAADRLNGIIGGVIRTAGR
jgi:glycosyltransferase involved in cell wall biosynthesis